MKGTSKKKFSKAFGVLRPRSRNSAAAPSSSPGGAISSQSNNLSASSPTPENRASNSQESTTPSSHPDDLEPGGSKDTQALNPTKRSADNERTMAKYTAAFKRLADVVEDGGKTWKGFTPLDLNCVVESGVQLQEQLEKLLDAWAVSPESQSLWSKGKSMVGQIFIATSPFIKHFLLVAKDAAQIPVLNPYGLVAGGLMLLITIADRVVARKAMVQSKVEYICRKLTELKTIEDLPNANIPTEHLTNRATDVLSSALTYLALHIRHEPGSSGVVGSILATVIKGDEECANAETGLKTAVEEFNTALTNFASRVGFRVLEVGMQNLDLGKRTYEIVDGLDKKLSFIEAEQIRRTGNFVAGDDKFIVPYQRNPHFKGRSHLLTKLHDKLCETIPDQYNHRVALYGLGGVGKTQLALEYVYTHRENGTYDRVYWVSAVSEATLFAGLREIGLRTNCILTTDTGLKPSEIASTVLRWLNKQEKWLLIIDNLDDMSVVDGYLPETAPDRHTIITTRSQHCDDIPAEGLEVGVLDITGATQLLLARAKVGTVADTPEGKKAAAEIVEELGFLPLAIDQAAAYIREASHDIFDFLLSYRKDRKFYHARAPKGNRTYPNSLAKTWHLSFEKVRQNSPRAAEFLKLLAFLNPDGVLIEFLERGKEGLTAELKSLVADRKRLYDALAELTRFSLIGRQEEGLPRITIHRLVQSIIRDDMSPTEYSAMMTTVIALCEFGFPVSNDWATAELRQLGRRYQDQVLQPLRVLERVASVDTGHFMGRVGCFLLRDGNYQQASVLIETEFKILETLKGPEHSDTLMTIRLLALTYRMQGRWEEALKLLEKILAVKKKLGENEDADGLRILSELAAVYFEQGRWDDAQKLLEKVSIWREKAFGQEDPETLAAMANLALLYHRQGRWKAAEKLCAEVVKLRVRVLGPEHPDTLFTMETLGLCLAIQGNDGEAQRLAETVLELRVKVLGQDHPDTYVAMTNLAGVYHSQGKWEAAQKLKEIVLAFRMRVLGPDHPDTIWGMASSAHTYQCVGAISRSIELLETAKRQAIRIFGPEHPDTLRITFSTAISYQQDGRLDDAVVLLENTVEAQRRILGAEHPHTLQSAEFLASWRDEQRVAKPNAISAGLQSSSDHGDLVSSRVPE